MRWDSETLATTNENIGVLLLVCYIGSKIVYRISMISFFNGFVCIEIYLRRRRGAERVIPMRACESEGQPRGSSTNWTRFGFGMRYCWETPAALETIDH